MSVIVLIVVIYAIIHLATGHARYRYRRRRYGHCGVGTYWNSAMHGPWVGVPLPGGFRISRRL